MEMFIQPYLVNPPAHELVINWHITEACNYSCQYCFAKWEKDTRELIHNVGHCKALLRELRCVPEIYASRNVIYKKCTGTSIRLNVAGGEPFLYPKQLEAIANESKVTGIKLSCITNASRLDRQLIRRFAPDLRVLGVSVDSVCERSNREIGRFDKNGTLNLTDLCFLFDLARQINPSIEIKINTVVNALNWTSDLSEFIDKVKPNKWKVLKVLPVLGDSLVVSDVEYHSFIRRHEQFSSIMTVEDNTAMTASYLMIDPLGRFYQNRENGGGYDYSDPILDVGVQAALAQVNFNAERYLGRY